MQFCSNSLERNGIPVSQWIERLIDPNLRIRIKAGKVVYAMMSGIESVDLDIDEAQFDVHVDVDKHRTHLSKAIFDSLSQSGFLVKRYLSELVQIEAEVRRQQREETQENIAGFNRTSARLDRIVDRLTDQLNETFDPERSKLLTNRLRRMVFIAAPSPYPSHASIELGFLPIAIQFVMSSARHHWLQAPEIIEDRLKNHDDCHDTLKWIGEIGREGQVWLPTLKKLFVERDESNFPIDQFRTTILAIGREDLELKEWLVWQLDSGNKAQRRDALFLLAEMSADSHELMQKAIENFANQSEFDFAAFDDLIAIGRHHRFIRLFAIEMAKPSPPQWKKHTWNQFTETYDTAMHTRSCALESFKHLGDYVDEFGRVLLDAMDTFQEYDPDWCYQGPHGRVSDIIESLGPAAGPLATSFADRLMDALEEGEHARAMLDALASIGAKAIDAIPAMQRYREATHDPEDGPMVAFSGESVIDELDDRVGAVMQLIHCVHRDSLSAENSEEKYRD